MSIRLLALIVLGIIALPLVFLHRSSIAGPPDYCRLKAEVFRLIASERDRGVSKKKFLEGFQKSLRDGKLDKTRYLYVFHWTEYVYQSPLTGLQLYEETLRSCRAMRSIEA